ncbi:hypothetical protein MMC07_004896 [Pseudocyphellaria aurata]|nr:hypothetical protein [Pseudocyphellaria aurata]
MAEPGKPATIRRSSAELDMPGMWKWPAMLGGDSRMLKQNEERTDHSSYQTLTHYNVTTPTVSIPRIQTLNNSHRFDTSPPHTQPRSRSHQSSSSSRTAQHSSRAAGKAPERRPSSSSSDDEDGYGEVIAPRLDLAALRQLPPRLQVSLLAMQRERDLRAAQEVERLPLPTPQRTTALGSHPPTDDEREYARGLSQRHREAANLPPLRTGPQTNWAVAPFMEHDERGLPDTKTGPPPAGRRILRRTKSLFSLRGSKPKVAERLASAKKWVMRVFKERGAQEGGGQGGEKVEGEGGEEGEREEAPEAGQEMTSRGRLEGYF